MTDLVPIFRDEKHINALQIECDSLISYLRQRASGKRRFHRLILTRITGIRESLRLLEDELAEESEREA